MPLSKEAQRKLLKALRVADDVIKTIVDDDKENDVDLPKDIKILSDTELATRDDNSKKEGETTGKKGGERDWLNMTAAEITKQTGIVIDASKIERFADVGKILKAELDKTTDDRLKTVNQQVQDLLKDKTTLTTERDNAVSATKKTQFEYNQFKNLPDNRAKNMNESEYLTLLSARGIEVKEDGVYRNGEVMKVDATKAPMTHKDAYNQLFTEFKWIAEAPAGAQGGRGGGNSGAAGAVGGKSRTFTEAQDKWLEENPGGNLASVEFDTFVATERKDNPAFDSNK